MESVLTDQIERVYIDREVTDTALAGRARRYFGDQKCEVVRARPFAESAGALSASEFERSKRHLYLTEFKGAFFKRCPGAKPGLSCCNYFVLNLGQQCNMNCSYCYLQSYLNSPVLTLYTNIERAIDELREMAMAYPDRAYRVGTGEVMDSLSMDDLTHYSRDLIAFFKDWPNWTLEFKTKSSKVAQFLDEEHAGNVIVSWSINPEEIVTREEHGTASLAARLEAARLCRARGFTVAFHIDPMIWHPEWQRLYGEMVDQILAAFQTRDVKWITVGALRFPPEQRHMMRERFGTRSLVTQAEVFPSAEGKLRYDRDLRTQMFQFVVQRFQKADAQWRVSLCMETKESWATTMASTPRQIPEIADLFQPMPAVGSSTHRL